MFTSEGFSAMKKILNKTDKELLVYLQAEPSPVGGKKPFSTLTTKKLHDNYLR